MKTKTIQHTILIRATPEEIYDALMNGKKHSQFTGAAAKIRAKAGAAFTCYDGYITGLTLELKPGRRIVQAWRSRDWTDGHYSIVIPQRGTLAKKSGGPRNCVSPKSAFRRMIAQRKIKAGGLITGSR